MTFWAFSGCLVILALPSVGCLQSKDDGEQLADDVVETSEAALVSSPHLMLGVPVDATPADDYVMTKPQYALSYNNPKRGPNWVAWRVQASDLGSASRSNSFRADSSLPAGFYAVTNADYKGSGYSRGHMCPSADRTATAAANSETFLFTNIVPQTTELNSGPWQQLETIERSKAASGKDIYVLAGALYGATSKSIGKSVTVPTRNYKIVVELPKGATLADVTATTPIIVVDMPNERAVRSKPWTDFKTTLGAVEALSGYKFLTSVPDAVHDALAAQPPAP
jgi:endonuclease G